ncbi:MAG: TPM domain-containing protein [Propionibacteriaceae bacterium]|jgi:uncharacterized protein|nr:TPM domain-containing protein [Propionibacteriaceae bacterium]
MAMLRKALAAVAVTMLTLFAAVAPAAADTGLGRVAEGERLPRFVDDMGLLTADEAAALTAKLDEISLRHNFDVVVVDVAALDDREARLYAADFYEENFYGLDEEHSGAILLLAMEDRDFGFATTGTGIAAFTVAGQKYLDTLFLPQLGEDDWYGGFTGYADAVDDFLNHYEAGDPYDYSNIPDTSEDDDDEGSYYPEYDPYPQYDPDQNTGNRKSNDHTSTIVMFYGGALVLALIAALSVLLSWKGKLKSVKARTEADDYIRKGSFVLTAQSDTFLYSNVVAVPRPKDTDSGGGSFGSHGSFGGFSSSGGSSFSGHSGKF